MAFDNYTAPPKTISPSVISGPMPATGIAPKDMSKTVSSAGSTGTTRGTTPLGSPGSSMGTAGGSTSTTNTNSTTTTNSTDINETLSRVQNMDDASLAALNKLIAQLEGGGTPEMLADRMNKMAAIATAQQQQQAYSKEAAFADAKGAMDAQTRQVMESLLPSLTRSAEGSGSSRNSMRALLEQQGAQRAAESASVVGLKAATDYGQVQNGISSILAQLVALKDPAADALLSALGIAKGAVQTNNTKTVATHQGVSNTVGRSVTNTANNAPTSVGITPGTLGGSGGSGGYSSAPVGAMPRPPAPVPQMSFYGNFNPSNPGGFTSDIYGSSGQTMADYLGLPPADASFADQFTFRPPGT